MPIDYTSKTPIKFNALNNKVNVARDEYDDLYLIDAPFHKFRGTNYSYRHCH